MTADVGIGLVGCGRLAEVGYLPALRDARGVRLVAVADPDPGRRRRAAQRVPSFDSAAALLASAAVDALVLATPAVAHLQDARFAAAAGVPVLVEKPPALNAVEAAALAALTPRPWIGFNRRFAAGPTRLRQAIPSSGRLDLRLELCYRRGGWGAHTVADDALLDVGVHLVDLVRWLSGGEPTGVRDALVSGERAEFELLLERGRARVRCATNRPHRERIEARGAGGKVLARCEQGGLRAALVARVARRGGAHPLTASLRRQLEAFARAVRGGTEPILATAADGHAVMEILAATRACAQRGGQQVTLART